MKAKTFTFGFSPCPNDTFMFDAMVHKKIDTEGLNFEYILADIEKLNCMGFEKSLDIVKVSYPAFFHLLNDYVLLDSGGAMGDNVGPILVSKSSYGGTSAQINNLRIAIPGKYTTSNFLLSLAFPSATRKYEMVFSDIEQAILNEKVDAGVIIHESRFTYQKKGLKKIMDLGEYWTNLTKTPVPLAGIVIKRSISPTLQHKVNRILRRSIEFAFANPVSSKDFVKKNAQEMEEEIMQKHIALYVNEFSLSSGDKGKKAIETMFEKAVQMGLVEKFDKNIFC